MSLSNKCSATNRNGKKCTRNIPDNESLCYQHKSMYLHKELMKKISEDMNKDANSDINLDVSSEVNKDVSSDVKKDVSSDVKKDVSSEVKEDINIKKYYNLISEYGYNEKDEKEFILTITNDIILKITDLDILNIIKNKIDTNISRRNEDDNDNFLKLKRCVDRKIKRLTHRPIDPEYESLKYKHCPYTKTKVLCNNQDCRICFCRSFAYDNKSKYWSTKNILKPRQIVGSTTDKFYFNCIDCGHDFLMSLRNIRSGNWCSLCSSNEKCMIPDCKLCVNKYFSSVEKSKYWSVNNIDESGVFIDPKFVYKSSHSFYKFVCDECKHEFEKTPKSITNNEEWCPYCNDKKLCNNDCNFCFNNSFASVENSKYLIDKTINPRYIHKGSKIILDFDCVNCNKIYTTNVYLITKNVFCPCTVNKTEFMLLKHLIQNYKYEIIHQAKFQWCKNIFTLPFDFCIDELKLIIELDGDQHFRQVWNWDTPEDSKNKDKYKMKCANENGYSVIRLYQMDVFRNKENWDIKLKEAIKKYDIPTNIFIGKMFDDKHIADISDVK
jgi:very-short-patch-repair endonuclease